MASNRIDDHVELKDSDETRSGRKGKVQIKIGWKITSIITIVFTVLAAGNIIFARNRIKTVMEKEFQSKAKAVAFSVASASEEKVLSGDFDTVQGIADGYIRIYGIKYVYVKNDSGEVVAHTFVTDFPEEIKDLNPVSKETEFTIAEISRRSVGRVLEVGVPILYGVAGTAHVGMNMELVHAEMASMTSQLVVQFAVAFILGVILLHLGVKVLLKPIDSILGVLDKAGRGDLTARLDLNTRDEFTVLADGLNAMLDRLGTIIGRVRQSFASIAEANEKITQVYTNVLTGTQKQADLASETEEFVKHSKEMIDEVNSATQVLEDSATMSFSSIMEMGASIEEVSSMSDSLFRSVKESNSAIEDLSVSINEISNNLLTLSTTTEETSSAMNEMGLSIQQVRENADSASEDSIKMTRTADDGRKHSLTATEGALAIKESSSQVSQHVSTVNERIEEIDEILSFITDITGKTNLLALNAAIIAAQAGAHGKGFGVVADEINELAQNTKAQTNRIAGVVQGIRDEVTLADQAVKESVTRVEDGVHLTEQAGISLVKILESTDQVSQRIVQIAQATSEQAQTSQRVTQITEHLAVSVDNIKKEGQKQSQSSDKLLEMSRRIQEVAQKVKMSTEEQTKTSQQINKDLARIDETVKGIVNSTEKQARSGAKVLEMTESLAGIIKNNRDAVFSLKDIIDDISGKMEFLQAELRTFVLDDS